MRPILCFIMILGVAIGAIGFPMLLTGTYDIGGALSAAAVGACWYAFRKAHEESRRRDEYDRLYRARIDAYMDKVHDGSPT